MKRVLFWAAFLPLAFLLMVGGFATMLFVYLGQFMSGLCCVYSQLLDNWEHWCYDTETSQWGKQTLTEAFLFGWDHHRG
jgi:hypothetical protein